MVRERRKGNELRNEEIRKVTHKRIKELRGHQGRVRKIRCVMKWVIRL